MRIDVMATHRNLLVLIVPLLLLAPGVVWAALTGPLFPNPVIGIYASGIVVGEFNGDGIPDVAIGAYGEVVIEPGRGDGTFGPERRYPIGYGIVQLVPGDFDGDGRQDLAVLGEGYPLFENDGAISVLLGLGDGSFAPQPPLAVGLAPKSVALGDFNGDGGRIWRWSKSARRTASAPRARSGSSSERGMGPSLSPPHIPPRSSRFRSSAPTSTATIIST